MKKILSIVLALTMLLACSLPAFALEMKEPCEEPGCTGEIMPHFYQREIPGYIICPQCGELGCTATEYGRDYVCSECDAYAYSFRDYYRVLCDWCYYFDWYGDVTRWDPGSVGSR